MPEVMARNFPDVRFFDSPFLADNYVEAKLKTMGCWVRQSPLLSHSKWVSVIAFTGKAVFVRTVIGCELPM